MSPEVLGVIGAVIGSVLTFLGVRFAARQSRKAAETTAQVSARQVDVEEWRAIVGELRSEVDRLSGRVERLEKDRAEDRALIAKLEADIHSRELRHRSLIQYVRELLAWGRLIAPEREPPRPPSRFAEELQP